MDDRTANHRARWYKGTHKDVNQTGDNAFVKVKLFAGVHMASGKRTPVFYYDSGMALPVPAAPHGPAPPRPRDAGG